MTTQQPEALRLADEFDWLVARGITIEPRLSDAATELRRQHARIAGLEATRVAYASEFAPNPDGYPDVGSIHKNIRALKAQLEAIEAGGVEPLRVSQQEVTAQEPFGYVNTATSQFFKDVEHCRKNNEGHWRTVYGQPQTAFTAADMATAAAQGFRDGQASMAQPAAGQEPMIRFCPGCGSLGKVEPKYRDCCPDGSSARAIPAKLAQQCHDLFQLAVSAAAPQPAVAAGWKLVPETPTQLMVDAAKWNVDARLSVFKWADGYYAMLAAAPLPPAPSTEGESRG